MEIGGDYMFSKLFVYTVLGTVVFMVANAFAGAVLSGFEDEFEWNILFKSLEKYISLANEFWRTQKNIYEKIINK